MANILLAGEIMAEKQYLMDEIPSIKEVGMVNEVNQLTSSKIINAGRILAVGNKVTMFGCVGNDSDGEAASTDFKRYKIDSNLVYKTDKAPTGQVLVLTNERGQSGFIVFLSANNFFEPSKLKTLKGYDYIYMSSSMKLPKLYELIEKAESDGVKVFLDLPNQQKEFDKSKLKTVEFVVPNRQEAEKLLDLKISDVQSALTAVAKLKSYTDGNAVISMDEDGCVVFGRDWKEPKHFPTQKVKVVDETGSGDIFRGEVLRQYLATHNLEQSVTKALRLATLSIGFKRVDNSIEKIKLQII